ncbi:hypothetical protein [Leyella stercorea]|uniref:hypothetical protein n=1 Tax=Leyella stercorea TaxID=363265 RepID=UPI002672C73F|nr:hypothetical protein [Leyella stercorea]
MKKNHLNKLRNLKEEIKTALLYKDYDKAMEGIGKLEDFIDNNNVCWCNIINCKLGKFLNNLPPQTSPGTVPNSEPLKIRVAVKTPEGKKKSFFDIVSIPDNSKDSPLLHKFDKYTIDKNKAVAVVIPQNENGKFTK